MAVLLEEISTITAKGQTTVPKFVRHALGLDRGGKIAFRVDEQGVSVIRAEAEHDDPTINAFLAFLANDMERRPHALTAFPASTAERIADLTGNISVDLSAPIEGAVDL
jgi:antitoxin PrlF